MTSPRGTITGETITAYHDLSAAIDSTKRLFPYCTDYLDDIFLPTALPGPSVQDIDSSHYYPPSTLCQIKQLMAGSRQHLLTLASKVFFGPKKIRQAELVRVLEQKADDAKILLDLRQFHTPAEFDRSKSRVREVTELPPFISKIKISSYLDYGGGDGMISSAMANLFRVPKATAYSADVATWFDRSVPKKFKNITYITLKEGQSIPLPDKSIDIVTCFQVLHHIRDINFTLSELRRVCKICFNSGETRLSN